MTAADLVAHRDGTVSDRTFGCTVGELYNSPTGGGWYATHDHPDTGATTVGPFTTRRDALAWLAATEDGTA